MNQIQKFLRSELGSVESALVIIPLLTLFLTAIHLTEATFMRDELKMQSQSEASTRALSGNFEQSEEFVHIDSSDSHQNLDLVVVTKRADISSIISGRSVEIGGIAVVENQR